MHTIKRAPQEYERLSCRIHAHIKERAERAAQALGQNITTFTETALAEKADAVLQREEEILLSERDFTLFMQLIQNAPAPTDALRRAAQDYKRFRAGHPDSNW